MYFLMITAFIIIVPIIVITIRIKKNVSPYETIFESIVLTAIVVIAVLFSAYFDSGVSLGEQLMSAVREAAEVFAGIDEFVKAAGIGDLTYDERVTLIEMCIRDRFWDINRGKITVGGMDISKIEPEALLSLYSIVFQDVTLFNNTIMENIRIGRKNATDEEVIEAARLANCEEFAAKLPNGYNSMIGENGCELSGGERQRISIARAFLKNAPIILLDEATSSLDVENETLIQTALSRLIKDKTVLVIAHRMRTVSGADKVVVLADGVVAEQGEPKELMNTGKIYPHIVKLQTISKDWGI